MPHTPEEKKKVITRVRRIRGQLEALEQALNQDSSCSNILQQIAAIRGATNGLMAEVLESHLRETLDPQDSEHCNIGKSVDDAVALIRSYLK